MKNRLYFVRAVFFVFCLYPASRCAILIIKKGKARTHGLPLNNQQLTFLQGQPFTICGSGRLFSSLEYLIKQTYKGHNEYSNLNQVLICNIHWLALLSFVWRVSPSENGRVGRLDMYSGFPYRQCIIFLMIWQLFLAEV